MNEYKKEYIPWLPFWTLLKREVLRFKTTYSQTLITPVISAALYLLVFGISLGSRVQIDLEVPYIAFILPGLVIMGVCQSAFSGGSSTLFMPRYLNYIIDFLVTPLTPFQFVMASTLASMLRSLLVGIGILILGLFFTEVTPDSYLILFVFFLISSFLFSQVGILVGLFADNFETMATFNNFVLLPLIYLSGMFYPLSLLPDFWRKLSVLNPMYYIVGGFRGAWLGIYEVDKLQCMIVAGLTALFFFMGTNFCLQKGYKLR